MIKKHIIVTIIALISAIIFLIATFGASMVYINNKNASLMQQNSTDQANSASEETEEPKEKITISLIPTKDTTATKYGDMLGLKVGVKNVSSKTVSYSFNDGCNEPVIHIDGKDIYPVKLCTQALTSVKIEPGKTITTDYNYKLIKDDKALTSITPPYTDGDGQLRINLGAHTLTAKWQDIESESTTLVVTEK
jgi:hypothetical protein